MKAKLKILIVVVVSVLLTSCLSNITDRDKPESLFPSKLLNSKCFKSLNKNSDRFFRHVLYFDTNGHFELGYLEYQDSRCSKELDLKLNVPQQKHSYSIGRSLMNLNGELVTQLVYPDPEGVGPSGSVYVIDNQRVCFASGTFKIERNLFHFTHVTKNGNFKELKIDKNNCFKVLN